MYVQGLLLGQGDEVGDLARVEPARHHRVYARLVPVFERVADPAHDLLEARSAGDHFVLPWIEGVEADVQPVEPRLVELPDLP